MRKAMVVMVSLVGVAGLASADPKADRDKARAQAIEEARKAGVLGPKGVPQVAELAKVMAGTWTCTGALAGPDGTAIKLEGHMTNTVELAGRWLHESMDVAVGEGKAPGNVRFEAYITYDAGPKKWRRIEVDSVGNHTISSAVPSTTGKLEWLSDETAADGKTDQQRTHFDGSDPKRLHVVGEMSTDKGKTWVHTAEMSCAK